MRAVSSRLGAVCQRRLQPLLWLVPLVPIAGFLLWETRGQTLYADEWFFFVHAAAGDPRGLLEPDQGNMVFGAVLVYKATLSIAGAGDHLSLRIVWVALDLLCAGLFFTLMRARVGAFTAAVPALVLTVFGASWEMFGGSLGINVLTSVAAGLAALLALERRADPLACLLLTFSIVSHSTGFAFVAWALASVLFSPERRARIWLLGPPLILYGAWYLWARQFGQSEITLQTVSSAPAAVVSLLASAAAAMSGTFRYAGPPELGTPDLVIFANEEAGIFVGALIVVAIVWRFGRVGLQSRFAPPLLAIAAYWASIALVSPARDPATGRYHYASAIFLLLLAGELWRGWRPSRAAAAGIAAIGLVALVPNVINLHYAAQFVRGVSEQDEAKLAVVDALRDRLPPDKIIEPPPANIGNDIVIPAGEYFEAVDSFGSPAIPIDRLPDAGIVPRLAADRELVYLLELGTEPTRALPIGPRCFQLAPGSPLAGNFRVPRGGFELESQATSEITVGLRRFGYDFFNLEPAPSGSYRLRIPDDDIPQPWFARVEAAAPVRICPLVGA
jgi:hypothetical protein